MGRLPKGMRAFGFSSGLAVKVGKELPGPHKISAWRPGEAIVTAWGIANPGRCGSCKGMPWGKNEFFEPTRDSALLQLRISERWRGRIGSCGCFGRAGFL